MVVSIVHITFGTMDPTTFMDPAKQVASDENVEITVSCGSSEELDNDALALNDILQKMVEADFVLIRCQKDPYRYKCFDRIESRFPECRGCVMVYSSTAEISQLNRKYFSGSDEDYQLLYEFSSNRGFENDMGIVYWVLHHMGLVTDKVPEPLVPRHHGVYHPDLPRDVGLDEYLNRLDPGKPTLGLLFVATYWVYRNLKHIDAFIRRAEERGMNIIPVFFETGSGISGKETPDIVRNYFTKDGEVLIDALVMNTPFSQADSSYEVEFNFYRRILNVPVVNAMMINGGFSDFEDISEGNSKKEFVFQSSWAEMDGEIVSVPIAETVKDDSGRKICIPLDDRIEHILTLCGNWMSLRRTPRSDRKVAIILYQSRPDFGSIGSAAGLDGPESAVRIIKRLSEKGYHVDHVPEDGKALIDEMMDNVTNNLDWTTSENVSKRSVALISKQEYMEWYSEVPEYIREKMKSKWGEPPGDVMVDRGKIIIPGVVNGNILITVQPMRSWMDSCDSVIHDPELVMPHQYLAFYRWLKDSFGVNAVIHLGTHGTVEWLPGKGGVLSSKCCPDIVLNGIPNIYPFQMDDPGEGLQAKRRSEAVVVGYTCMPMVRADSYGDSATLEGFLQEYLKSRGTMSSDRKRFLIDNIRELAARLSMDEDLGWGEGTSDDKIESDLPELNDRIQESANELIREGLHILGRVPADKMREDYVSSFTRIPFGNRPSLPDAIRRSGYEGDADGFSRELIASFSKAGYDTESCKKILRSEVPGATKEAESLVEYICAELQDKLDRTREELDSIIEALDGKYVMPGPSGAPTRSGPDILPSGRNYYGLDPATIPSMSAWDVGRKNADIMLEKHKEDNGAFPRHIGLIVWATDTLKTNGEDIAYALWLMGVRPVWTGTTVSGLEVIPLEELGRPRIDVTMRITGLFRDVFHNLIDLLDDAVGMVSELDEDDESNAIAANCRKEVAESIALGIAEDKARRNATVRIFGCAPGTYGSGMNKSIQSSQWEDLGDLAKQYSDWGSFAYGRGVEGEQMADLFKKRFSKSDALVKNMPDKEIGLVDMDDVYGYLGGLTAFVKANGNEGVSAYVGDTSDSSKIKVRSSSEALKLTFRSQIQNPKFIHGLMEHGYAGANEASKFTEYLFGWDATSKTMEKWMYDGLAESYLLDPEVYKWLHDENPFAAINMVKVLEEAIAREMWDADDEMKERLEEIYMDLEGQIEELTDR